MFFINAKVLRSVVDAVKTKFDSDKEAITNSKLLKIEVTRYKKTDKTK